MKIYFFEVAEEYPGFIKAGVSFEGKREIHLVLEQAGTPYVVSGYKGRSDHRRHYLTPGQINALKEFERSGRGTVEFWPCGI